MASSPSVSSVARAARIACLHDRHHAPGFGPCGLAQRSNNGGVALSTATSTRRRPWRFPTAPGRDPPGRITAAASQTSTCSASARPECRGTANGVAFVYCDRYAGEHSHRVGRRGGHRGGHDQRSGVYDIYARRVNSAGVAQWTANGVAICTATECRDSRDRPDNPAARSSPWQDQRSGAYDIYAQRERLRRRSGPRTGVAICPRPAISSPSSRASRTARWAFLVGRMRAGNYDVCAARELQRVAQWTANGAALCTSTGTQSVGGIASDGGTGAIVTWSDFRNGTDYNIYAQRVSATGTMRWARTATWSAARRTARKPGPVADGAGGAIIAWSDLVAAPPTTSTRSA